MLMHFILSYKFYFIYLIFYRNEITQTKMPVMYKSSHVTRMVHSLKIFIVGDKKQFSKFN